MDSEEQDPKCCVAEEKTQKTQKPTIPLKELMPTVCGAVLNLREVQGCTVDQIMNYLKWETSFEEKERPLVLKALKKGVESKFLKETNDGKYKLVFDDCNTFDSLLNNRCMSCCFGFKRKPAYRKKRKRRSCSRKRKRRRRSRSRSKCGKRRRRKKSRRYGRKKRRRRGCTKPWVPKKCKKKNSCQPKRKSKCRTCKKCASLIYINVNRSMGYNDQNDPGYTRNNRSDPHFNNAGCISSSNSLLDFCKSV